MSRRKDNWIFFKFSVKIKKSDKASKISPMKAAWHYEEQNMETTWSFVHSHQFAVIAVISVALIIIYFLFKNLIKLALLFLLILILTGSYFYLTAPRKSPADLTQAIKTTQEQAGQVIDKGKVAYDKGKEIFDKGKEITDSVSKVIGKDQEVTRKD